MRAPLTRRWLRRSAADNAEQQCAYKQHNANDSEPKKTFKREPNDG